MTDDLFWIDRNYVWIDDIDDIETNHISTDDKKIPVEIKKLEAFHKQYKIGVIPYHCNTDQNGIIMLGDSISVMLSRTHTMLCTNEVDDICRGDIVLIDTIYYKIIERLNRNL